MKKVLSILCVFLLAGCAKFHGTNQSVWSKGLWIVPWLLGVASIFFFWLAYRSSKSNSNQTTYKGTTNNTGNVSLIRIGFFWFSVVLFLAMVGVIIGVNLSR